MPEARYRNSCGRWIRNAELEHTSRSRSLNHSDRLFGKSSDGKVPSRHTIYRDHSGVSERGYRVQRRAYCLGERRRFQTRQSFRNHASLPLMSSAKVPDPSFTWRSHERWTWRSIGLLLAITAGGGFFVGRLSIAVPAEQPTGSKAEQQTASAGSVTQRQAALQSDVSAAPIHSSANKETKPETKDGPIEGSTASSMETPKRQSTTAIEKGASNSPVALIPSSAEKAADGGASKQPMFKTGLEAAAKANKKTKPHKAADDGSPAATATKRQANCVRAQALARRRASGLVCRSAG